MVSLILWGLVTAILHFFVVGALYQNPMVDKIYKSFADHRGMKKWPNVKEYLFKMFLGTLVEIYIMGAAYMYLRQFFPAPGKLMTAVALALIFSGIRIYPRSFGMWIQSSYPFKLIAIETVNGIIGTFVIVLAFHWLPM